MLKYRWVWVMGVGCVVGCGQELALPEGYGKPTASAGAGPADGVTGVGGAGGAGGSSGAPLLSSPVPASKGGTGGASKAGGGAGEVATDEPIAAGDGGATAGSAGEGGEVVVAPPPVLLFSEYAEGLKSNKALEIFALRGGSLGGCELQTFFNGKAEPTKLALEGELPTGGVYVLCSTELAKSLPACSRSTSLSFNGDDALALVCDGVIHDIIGEIGVDPGDSWGMGATLDHTLQRRCGVTVGRSDPATPFGIDAEWVTFAADTFSDLGQRACDALNLSTP